MEFVNNSVDEVGNSSENIFKNIIFLSSPRKDFSYNPPLQIN
jgi:hypothetical protein